MIRDPNICDACARLHQRRDPEAATSLDTWIPYCEAFPRRVPDDIYLGGFDHRNAYPGDSGIRFVQREGGERALGIYEDLVLNAEDPEP